ncbi:hypothetical protein DPSP01_006828 [Paraphaeosphaeria sporulosa]|uniref:DASH complex subunit DUO1 n=1 Tax=Paraphaeosphaeria sporulosa TaxID=1460663 RepID=A0A177CNF5_9PLEO|nr:uncharacterized protein CC84DRAFT_1162382 [Paraphaeosphaeria sporulosa]OAG08430.1 hypothetical protein CC84DRAFT_1162382 [Paraphaeosphaeria sporulosa]
MDDRKPDRLSLSDSDSDALFDAPAAQKNQPSAHDTADDGAAPGKARPKESWSTQEEREAALRKELESVRNVNKVIEGVVESLQKAKSNMDTVSRTVTNASTLLQTWTRILSQTEHNQRLILNPQWQGATQDLVDLQEEEVHKQQAAERRAAEEQARREAAQRKAEEAQRKAEATAKPTTRGRGRGGVRPRGASTSSTGQYSVSGQTARGGLNRSSSTSGRAGSGIGRGLRGRGRGLG